MAFYTYSHYTLATIKEEDHSIAEKNDLCGPFPLCLHNKKEIK